MESQNAKNEEENPFLDASDDFPFRDCVSTSQSDQSTSTVQDVPSPTTVVRHRSIGRRRISGKERKDACPDPSSFNSDITHVNGPKTSLAGRSQELCHDSIENEKDVEVAYLSSAGVDTVRVPSTLTGEQNEESTVTTASDDRVGDSVDSEAELGDSSSTDFLLFTAGLVIKAIGFQFNLLVSLITFPLWALYGCCLFVIDPFKTMRRSTGFLVEKVINVWNFISGIVSPFIHEFFGEHKSAWKLALRIGWGLFWALYVCFILCTLLVSSLVVSGIIVSHVMEEPIVIKENLNFDYTKHSPVAFVPLLSCSGVGCDVNCNENIELGKGMDSRVIPPSHKLQVTVSLTLPESEYNRNLGMFQVRVDFLSSYGQLLASSRHPCMLRFKSEPIRLLLTFLKIAPLVAGYVSESQTLDLKIRGITEGAVPTACIRVIIEQRAEFGIGAGIPEIYDASLILESQLPLSKRIIWYWKKTIFVWISIMCFIMELLFTLVCCRPLILPRTRQGDRSASDNSNQNSLTQGR